MLQIKMSFSKIITKFAAEIRHEIMNKIFRLVVVLFSVIFAEVVLARSALRSVDELRCFNIAGHAIN